MTGSIYNAISVFINAANADVSEKGIEDLIKIKDRLEKIKEKWEKKLDKLIEEAKTKIFNKKKQ